MGPSDMSSTLYNIDKLGDDNYYAWKFRSKMVLEDRDLWDVVSGDELCPEKLEAGKQWIKKDRKAMSQISLAVSDKLLVHIRQAKSAKHAWDSLEQVFEKKTLASRVFLRRKFFTTSLREGQPMREHINELTMMEENLGAMGAPIHDTDLAMTL